jgi:hypothetical protein
MHDRSCVCARLVFAEMVYVILLSNRRMLLVETLLETEVLLAGPLTERRTWWWWGCNLVRTWPCSVCCEKKVDQPPPTPDRANF